MRTSIIVVVHLLLLLLIVGCVHTNEKCLIVGDGESRPAWREIVYDEFVTACRANLLEWDTDRHVLERIAGAYPNLSVLSVQCLGLRSGLSMDIDCHELLNATNLVCLEICNLSGTVRNIKEICSDTRKNLVDISFSPGSHIFQHENICRAIDDSPVDMENCITGSRDSCKFNVDVYGGIYCFEDNVHRSAQFFNEGNGIVGIKCFPPNCNTVELYGAFDISKVGVCESVNMLSWNCDGEDFQRCISEVNSGRFPNLHFLTLSVFADQEYNIDFGSLAKLKGIKVIDLQLSNVVPTNMDVLYGIDGLWGIIGCVSVFRDNEGQ